MPDCLCLIVSNNFPPNIGGAGGVYAALARAAAGMVHVLCAATDYRAGGALAGWREHDARCGFPVHRIAEIRPPLAGAGRMRELLIRARLFARICSLRRRLGFRVLTIADDETVGWLIGPAQRLLGCRVILYVHGDDLAIRPGQERLDARRRRQFARADAIVAVSTTAVRDLQYRFGVPPGRVTLVPNGIDTRLFRPLPPDPALADRLGVAGKRVLIALGRLVPRKGVDRVITAFGLLRARFPDAHLLVIGDGPERASLQEQAAGMANVGFTGAIAHADVPRHLALCEAVIVASRRLPDGEDEGFPLVHLEANACGKPVIAGDAGGARDAVRDGENGLLVDAADPAAIAAAIRRLLTNPDLAAHLASSALGAARAADWSIRAQPFLALCAGLARSGTGVPRLLPRPGKPAS